MGQSVEQLPLRIEAEGRPRNGARAGRGADRRAAREIVFTSCATESNNAALHAALRAQPAKRHVITSAVEHSSVLSFCRALESEGVRVTYLPVDRDGLLTLADLEAALDEETALVSLM